MCLLLHFVFSSDAHSAPSLLPGCGTEYSTLHLSDPRFQPRFSALKLDLPTVTNPVQLVTEFQERRRLWNLQFPIGHARRNEFPASELAQGATEARRLLKQIRRPPENRAAAEKLIQEIDQSEALGFPYRQTFRKIEAATYLVQLRYRSPVEKAAAVGLSTRFASHLPAEIQKKVQALVAKHQLENVIPVYDIKDTAQLDQFEKRSSAYFKDLRTALDDFFLSPEGREFRANLVGKIEKYKKNIPSDRAAKRAHEQEESELQAFLKIFADENRTGIQRYVTSPTISDNPTHPLVQPVDDSLFESELLLPTTQNLHIEGLAESFMLGITPVQIISRPRMADGQWMDSFLFANHDGFHRYLAGRESQLNREIINLPLPQRLEILTEIDRLPDPNQRSLARTALYLTVHENGDNSTLPITTPAAAAHTRDEFRRLAGRSLSNSDIAWVRNWYQQSVQRRVDDFRRAPPP